jgi:hypothetical protein
VSPSSYTKSEPAITVEVAGKGVAAVGRLGGLLQMAPKKLAVTAVDNDVGEEKDDGRGKMFLLVSSTYLCFRLTLVRNLNLAAETASREGMMFDCV